MYLLYEFGVGHCDFGWRYTHDGAESFMERLHVVDAATKNNCQLETEVGIWNIPWCRDSIEWVVAIAY
jgi:hypothetical protein